MGFRLLAQIANVKLSIPASLVLTSYLPMERLIILQSAQRYTGAHCFWQNCRTRSSTYKN
jgi:hypothetical protein